MDRIKGLMDQLSELGDDQVAELQAEILSEFESVENQDPTPQTVDAMTSLADMLDGVRTEVKRREAAVQELAARANEAASRVHGQEGDSAPNTDAVPAEETPEVETPAEDAAEPTEEPVPAAAAAKEDVPEDAPASPDMPSDSTSAPTEDAPVDPSAEAPVEGTPEEEAGETPADEDEEKKKNPVGEASTEADTNAEFSTQTETTNAAVTPEVTEASTTDSTTAVAEVVEGAEASIQDQTTESTEQPAQETMEAPVTAAANAENLTPEVPADRRPIVASVAPVAITAGADIPGYTAGSPLESMKDVSEAMAKRLHALRRVNGGDGEQHTVASLTVTFPESRVLTQDTESNWAKIQNVQEEAMVASGGHATPLETKYDIFGFGTVDRPVRDSLPRFQADRGGIRFITPPVMSDLDNAVGVWTNVVDTSPGTAVKNSLAVTASQENTVVTDAVTLQLQFGNLMTRAYPELIARHNELGLIRHARLAEQTLLTSIGDNSTAVTTASLIGFGRDFLVQVGRAAAAYRSRHRLEVTAPLNVIIPSWVKDAMAADLALSMPGDSTLNAYAEIEGYVTARGVKLTSALDQNVFAAQTAGALLEFADSFTWYIFAEGSFLFLDGGTLDLGIIRDSSLVGTNDYKMFVETFEAIAFVGIEALKVTSTISINGVAAALRDTTGGATAAAIEL